MPVQGGLGSRPSISGMAMTIASSGQHFETAFWPGDWAEPAAERSDGPACRASRPVAAARFNNSWLRLHGQSRFIVTRCLRSRRLWQEKNAFRVCRAVLHREAAVGRTSPGPVNIWLAC